ASALGCAVVAVAAATPNDVFVPIAATCAGGVAAIAMNAVRQWRFAPTRRVAEGGGVLVSAVVVAAWYPVEALEGRGWSLALLAAALAVCAGVAWPLVGRASEATARPSHARADHADARAVSAGPAASGRRTRRSRPRS